MPQHFHDAREQSSLLWNDAMKLHKFLRKRKWGWSSAYEFQAHFKKKGYALHSQTTQAIIAKLFSNIKTTTKNRKNGNKKARYPYKIKKHYSPVWKGQAIKIHGNSIILPNGNGNPKMRIPLPKDIQHLMNTKDYKITGAELGYFKLHLSLARKEKNKIEVIDNTNPDGFAAMDLGLIHTGVITNGKVSEAYVGRLMRSVNQGCNKRIAEIVRLQSNHKKYSRQWKKLQYKKIMIIKKRKNFLTNFYHHVSNKIVDFCLRNKIHTLVYGNIANISHKKKKKMSKRNNQEMSWLSLGQLIKLCDYKLHKHGIQFLETNEAYTSQTCPLCGHRHKVRGRNYRCKMCGFKAFRDEVGAYNILNKYKNTIIIPNECVPTGNIKYLRAMYLKPIQPSSYIGFRYKKERSRGADTPRAFNSMSVKMESL